jgi:hypothetical protein
MSASTEVTIQAPPDVETFILDHAFNLVFRGIGTFMQPLPPGLYKFKFRCGLAIRETLEEITEAPHTIAAPMLAFSSSVPLRNTRRVDERHLEAARNWSNEIHETIGAGGSRIFVFARCKPDDRDIAGVDAAGGLALHTLDGALLVDLQQKAERLDPSSVSCAGYNVELPPGAYRLRLTSGEEPLEQIVYASPGWQTQVFLMHESAREENGARPPVLASASILMSHSGFDPESEMLRMADGARIAMKQNRTSMPRELLTNLLDDKFENPMLGIYAAHALASSTDERDKSLFARVLNALAMRLVPDHPDVAALRLAAGESPVVIDTPPMLRASWALIVTASLEGRTSSPLGALSCRIPAALLDSTPWLIWSPNALLDEQATVVRDVSVDLHELVSCVGNWTEEPPPIEFTGSEEQVFSFLSRRARMEKRSTKSQFHLRPIDDKGLAEAFGTSVANVQAAVTGLATKLRGL